MVESTRAIWATGLALASLTCFLSPAMAQSGAQDAAVRRTASNSSAPASSGFAPAVPPTIGTIDIDLVFNKYEKFLAMGEEIGAAAKAKQAELMKILSEIQSEAEFLQSGKINVGTPDYKKHEDRITQLQAEHEAKKAQASREFEQREAEAYATLYKEIQAMSAAIAQKRGMTYIVKVVNRPISAAEPKSVMAAMASTLIYSDPHNDITNDVISNLNRQYRANGGQPPKSRTAAGPAAAPGGAPGTAAVPGASAAGER
jgi:Skp family chaperone for outer membrane proteins